MISFSCRNILKLSSVAGLRGRELPQGGIIQCGLKLSGNEGGGSGGGGSGGGRHAYGIVVVFAGMAHRSSIFEDKEGDTRSVLGGARSDRF